MKYIMAIMLFCIAIAATAQENLKLDSDAPIEITADGLSVNQQNRTAVFNGNVLAKQGKVNLRADSMTVYYHAKSGGDVTASADKNAVSKIDVVGNVFLSTPTETAQGGKGIYDVDQAKITLEENVVLTRGKNVVKGGKLIYDLKKAQSNLVAAPTSAGTKKRVTGYFVPEKAKN